MEPGAVELSGLTSELVVKQPGTVNGADVVLRDLRECEVYILDYSGEVEVSSCSGCKLFFGPVDGPAIFRQVQGCRVAVASQQCQVVDSSDLDLGLYCATKPSVERCFSIRVSCWMGAYAGLSKHFQQCNLDPRANLYDQVHSAGADDEFGPGFELVEAVEYWEPPVEGLGPPENPVPAPDGTMYQSPAEANGNAAPADNGFMDFMQQPGDNSGGQADAFGGSGNQMGAAGNGGPMPDFGASVGNQGGSLGATGGQMGGPQGDHPKVAAMKEQMQQRLQRQEEEERQTKAQLSEKAAAHLESFYQKRQERMAQRAKENRAEGSSTPGGLELGPGSSGSPWEKTLGFIDFGFQRGTSADKARFKNVLFSAKAGKAAV